MCKVLLEERVHPGVFGKGWNAEKAVKGNLEWRHSKKKSSEATDLSFGLIVGESNKVESFKFHRILERGEREREREDVGAPAHKSEQYLNYGQRSYRL